MAKDEARYIHDVETWNGLATGSGFANENGAMVHLFLKRGIPWKERREAADDLAAQILSQLEFLQPEDTANVPNTAKSQ